MLKQKWIRFKKSAQKGSSEAITFCCLMPFVVLMICAILAATHISITNQKLDYTAYNACRSAVVSETYEEAIAHAEQVYVQELGSQNSTEHGYAAVNIEILDGGTWAKGAYVRCTVRYYIETVMPFTSGVRERSIVMMVERG